LPSSISLKDRPSVDIDWHDLSHGMSQIPGGAQLQSNPGESHGQSQEPKSPSGDIIGVWPRNLASQVRKDSPLLAAGYFGGGNIF